jgi:nitrate reductase gamma subunit
VRTIDVARGSPNLLQGGPVQLTSVRPLGPVARYSEDFMFWRKTRYLAPIGRTRTDNGSYAYNLFIEVPGIETARVPASATGLLRPRSLMPEVAQMYVNAGYATTRDSAVVFASTTSADRAALVLMTQFLIFATVAALFALWLRRREQRRIKALNPA